MEKKFIIFILLLLTPLLTFAESTIINGFELPRILYQDWLQDGELVKYSRYPVFYDLQFFLSKEGCIDSLTFNADNTNEFIGGVYASLNNIDFSPARYLNENIPLILPARIEFVFEKYRPQALLYLPSESAEYSIKRDLIEKTLELNQLSPVLVKKIPSYFCHFERGSNPHEYPFAVFRVALDTAGSLASVETVFTNDRQYSNIFSNVLLYAKYLPATSNGHPIASNTYITVRFFKRVVYPTEIWPPSNEREYDFSYEYHRISYRPYIDSIVNPPFPINMSDGNIIINENIVFVDTVEVGITIDTLGNVKYRRLIEPTSVIADKTAKSIIKRLKYLPARGLDGSKIEFEGQLTIVFRNNSHNIRIISNWLLK
jgi:hypothetical protein